MSDALEKYGRHLDSCEAGSTGVFDDCRPPRVCSCGFDEALANLAPVRTVDNVTTGPMLDPLSLQPGDIIQRNGTDVVRLYAFQPPMGCHGPISLFVCAADEETARKALRAHMDEQKARSPGGYDYDYYGGDIDQYRLTVAEPGAVVENCNE